MPQAIPKPTTTRQQRIAIRQAQLTEIEFQMQNCKRNIVSERHRYEKLANEYNRKLWCFDPNFDDD